MLEVEVKARAPDPDAVRRRLGEPDAVFHEQDVYYQHPGRDFRETDEALRLRSVGDRMELTYKGPRLDETTKTREERTVGITSADGAALVLEALGFRPAGGVVKRREVWVRDDFTVSLDAVAGLGTFVEVETSAKDADEAAGLKDGALAVLTDLGLTDVVRESYLTLLMERETARR